MSPRIKRQAWSVAVAFAVGNFLLALAPGITLADAAERSFFQAFAIYWVSHRISQSEELDGQSAEIARRENGGKS